MKKIIRKIELFILFVICLLYCLIRGRADKKIKKPKKFLVAQMAKLGDMVCTTPVFHAIKEKDHSNQVYVLSSKTNKDLLENNPHIDGFFVYHKKGFWRLIKELRKENFDYGCIVDCNFVGLAILYLSGINFIVAPGMDNGGQSPYDSGYYAILRKLAVQSIYYRFHEYMPLARLRLLESADIFSKNIKKYLGFSSGAEYGINSFLESEGIDGKNDIIIAVHAGAGNRLKLWPAEKWAELIDKIAIKNNVKIIITGSKTDSKEVEAVLRLVKNRITDCSSKFNIDEFKALISKIDIFIACDSGPIYIAESFDKYIIDIIGPCDGLEQPPVRPFYEKGTLVFVKNLFCRPCSFVMKAARFCRYGNLKCLEETKVGDVLAVVDDVLVRIKK